jgi:hypothetical protein
MYVLDQQYFQQLGDGGGSPTEKRSFSVESVSERPVAIDEQRQ